MSVNQLKITLITFGMGAVAFWWAFKNMRARRLIEDTPTSRTRSAAQGLSEFQGYAWPLTDLAKCSVNNECVYYSLILEKYVKRGKNSSWESVFTNTLTPEFLLIDSTGAVEVIPHGGELSIQSRVTNWTNLNDNAKSYLLNNYIPPDSVSGFPPSGGFLGGLFSQSFRISEKFILLGSPVLVLGEFDSLGGKTKSLSENTGLLRFFEKVRNDVRLKVGLTSNFFDLNKDGEIDEDEFRRGLYYLARTFLKPTEGSEVSAQVSLNPLPVHGQVKKSLTHPLIVINSHENTYRKQGTLRFYLAFTSSLLLIAAGIYLVTHSQLIP